MMKLCLHVEYILCSTREEGNVKLVLPVHSIVWHRVSSAYLQRVGEFVGKDCWEIKCRRSRMILT
jgi:hypothetical protein